ncbi:putative dehydrogenase [Ereboglobus sp. PH5-5]|uniref:Gfo/Idh/MocA family protein n=1 Tax=Ereboglobus sp. PH5-5 TaxID=2940529 RepID=UPI002404F848|nr:Gfo/Idh/MocA family oxidoreductase [Ereboglobus sp. PH5-5]MDF9833351.1 putative dehydrogenase [Ereboglobus sp. PH5-5]
MSTQHLKWGLLATGRIAEKFANGLAASKLGRAVAVGSRSGATARAFAEKFGIARAHESYEALLADAEVDAVYIATPHPMHLEWALKAARAGKHILCEKPMGMNRAQTEQMIAAAREHGVFLMEAFMYRCHPQTARIAELIRDGALGEVRMVQAAFGYNRPFDPQSRVWSNGLGGGGILDVGCYPVSLSRFVAGAAEGKGSVFLDPVEINGTGVTHPQTGVDEWAAATLKFSTGMVAQVSCSTSVQQQNTARIYGTKGWLHVVEPWTPSRNEGGRARMWLRRPDAAAGEIALPYQESEYMLEADVVAECVASGRREAGQMSWADSLGNAAALDKWLELAGVKYGAA